MIIINLKGEIQSTLPEFHKIDSYKLVYTLINKNFDELNNLLQNIKENSLSLKISSFKESLKLLKISPSFTAHEFENIVFAFFNIIFPQTQRWGGKNLADGSYAIKYQKIKYTLWDSKRYDKSSLLKYVKQKGLKKDIKYMEGLSKNNTIIKLGNLKKYIFVTTNTSKKEFLKISAELGRQIRKAETETNIQGCKICCINKDQLIQLGDFFENNLKILTNNYQASKEIDKVLKKNDGYFDFNEVKPTLKRLTKEKSLFPKLEKLRKETKEIM